MGDGLMVYGFGLLVLGFGVGVWDVRCELLVRLERRAWWFVLMVLTRRGWWFWCLLWTRLVTGRGRREILHLDRLRI